LTGLALLMVLCAAFFHAFWNFIAKKACGGTTFVWLFNMVAAIVYIPVVIGEIWVSKAPLQSEYIIFMVGSAILHLGYFILLNRGYDTGDLSLVYPLARGTGPLLVTIAAVVFLGERPSLIALMGTLFIAVGVFLLLGNPTKCIQKKTSPAVLFAIVTGVFIASYTLWDKYAVSSIAVPPIVMYWGTTVGQAVLMVPYALKNREEVIKQWQTKRLAIVGVAILCPLSYILVLTAMSFTPVSYVAPVREASILIGAIMGARFLNEGDTKLRIGAAIIILCGITSLALG